MLSKFLRTLVLPLFIATLAACGGSGGDSTSASSGTLKLWLGDAPRVRHLGRHQQAGSADHPACWNNVHHQLQFLTRCRTAICKCGKSVYGSTARLLCEIQRDTAMAEFDEVLKQVIDGLRARPTRISSSMPKIIPAAVRRSSSRCRWRGLDYSPGTSSMVPPQAPKQAL